MLKPTSLKEAPRYPVTTGISALAIAVTVLWWTDHDIEGWVMTGRVWEKWELWRAFTSTLPHVDFFHLAFNLYWFWAFGTLIERVYGHLRLLAIFLLLAFVSSLGEFTFLNGGVGLSGVGYGLWAMLWVLEQRDPRFADAVDAKTSQTFVGWFFLCIFLTISNIWQVANVAHGVGAGMGFLLGNAIPANSVRRRRWVAGIVVVTIFFFASSTIFWPRLNFSEFAEAEVERAALRILDSNTSRAVQLLESCTHMRNASARVWYNLGIAYQRAKRYDEALAAYEHAASMPDAENDYREAFNDLKRYKALNDVWNRSLQHTNQ